MFGKGTFKSSAAAFRPGASLASNVGGVTGKFETAAGNSNKNSAFLAVFAEAEKAETSGDSIKAVQLYNQFLTESDNQDEEIQRLKELAIVRVGHLIRSSGDFGALAAFVRSLKGLWTIFPRAKTAKIVKGLLELFEEIGSDPALLTEIELCRELLAWSEEEKRGFLKQALETRLVGLFHRTGQYSEALALVGDLLKQLKRLDDKAALIDVHLLESKIYFALKNLAKSRAALTAARTYANAMYTAPVIQAALDMQAGLLHAEETDFKTAFSYFIESLDNYVNASHDPRGAQAFKYLLLCKIMLEQADEVEAIINGKLGQHYAMNRNFEAMQAVAQSCIDKSLKSFEQVLQTYPKELGEDAFVQSHLAALYDNLLEQNLLHLALPYSRVQISFIASKIGLSPHDIEVKLSQMILDKILPAIIDHNTGCLLISANQGGKEAKVDVNFKLVQNAFKNMDSVLESLVLKSKNI